jgi:FkbM family methyltransferase
LINIKLNNYHVIAEQCAVSETTGSAVIHTPETEHVYSASLEKDMLPGTATSGLSVPTVRLDEYFASKALSPDLIKIDVEKHEPAVLRGMGHLLSDDKPTIIIEVIAQDVADQIGHLIEDLGYEVYHVLEDSGIMRVQNVFVTRGDDRNFLLIQPDIARKIT